MPLRVPFLNVKVEGQDITPWIDTIAAVEDEKQADNVTFTIPDPRMIYGDALFEGCTAEIEMGYAGAGEHALILRAIITKVETAYPEDGIPKITVKGEDRSILMGLRERKRFWHNLKVTEIVRRIANENGFHQVEASLNPDPVRHRGIHQDSKTDLAFLQDLASKYKARCFVELDDQGKEVLFFIPERRIVRTNRSDQMVLTYKKGSTSNLINFSPTFDTGFIDRTKETFDVDKHGNQIQSQPRPQPAEEVTWQLNDARMATASQRDKDLIQKLFNVGAAKKKDLFDKLRAKRPSVGEVAVDQEDLESDSDTLESHRLGMTANGTTFGNIFLRAKSDVTITGPSERWSGDWYVVKVTHRIDAHGFKTDFKCVR